MKSEKLQIKQPAAAKIKITILLFLTGGTLIFTNTMFFNVSSQTSSSQETAKSNMSVEQQEQLLIEILRNESLRLNSPRQVVDAIKQLGKLKSAGVNLTPASVAVLIELLDFKKDDETDSNSIIIGETHLSGPSEKYPAIGALFYFGKPVLPSLAKTIADNEPDSVKSLNSLTTIDLIFRSDISKPVEFLEELKENSLTTMEKDRIELAVQKLKKNSGKAKN